MKKLVFILLLAIPFFGFGQTSSLAKTLSNSVWKITLLESGFSNIIVLRNEGSFGMISDLYGIPTIYDRTDEDWKVVNSDNGEKIVITFSNRFLILSGNVYGKIMSGKFVNNNGLSGNWKGEKLN